MMFLASIPRSSFLSLVEEKWRVAPGWFETMAARRWIDE